MCFLSLFLSWFQIWERKQVLFIRPLQAKKKVQDEKERLKQAKRKKEPSRNKNIPGNKRKLAIINTLVEIREDTILMKQVQDALTKEVNEQENIF